MADERPATRDEQLKVQDYATAYALYQEAERAFERARITRETARLAMQDAWRACKALNVPPGSYSVGTDKAVVVAPPEAPVDYPPVIREQRLDPLTPTEPVVTTEPVTEPPSTREVSGGGD